MNAEFAPLFKLGRAERLQLVEDLWDSIAQETSGPLSETSAEKLEELRLRKHRLQQNPASGLAWDQVKDQARAKGL